MAEKTREAMLVCEAAGFDVILVETVGVGQSETTVAGMVDVFVLLQLPNAGDDLQAIKRGIVELADIVVINKADIDPKAAELRQAAVRRCAVDAPQRLAQLALPAGAGRERRRPDMGIDRPLGPRSSADYRKVMTASGELQAKRQRQAVDWMWTLIDSEPAQPVPASPAGPTRPGCRQPCRGRRPPDSGRRRPPAAGTSG